MSAGPLSSDWLWSSVAGPDTLLGPELPDREVARSADDGPTTHANCGAAVGADLQADRVASWATD
eukprot:15153594-Alexandrium_andersonii.AAC.1